jgi:Molecular chaperone (small heat shock protein)
LIIEGKEEKEEETKDKNYFKKEIIRGEFKRVVPLPCEVDVDKAEATFESGILTIVLPKIKEEKKDREISIK